MGRTRAPAAWLAVVALLASLGVAAALEVQHSAQIAATELQPAPGTAALGGGAGSDAPAEATLDDSVRCRLSGICDSPDPACNGNTAAVAGQGEGGKGEAVVPLACITSDEGRAAAVVEAARHAWSGYRDCAWGEDELRPLSCSGVHWLNLSLTMVDSLDTLYLLGMKREFEEAAEWLVEHLDVGAPAEVNLFETTIRVLGGLLSAQALSAGSHPGLSRGLALKAAELGARLMPAFTSPSGVPYSDVNLRTGQASPPAWGHISSLSEMCSVSLEFTYLARITGHMPFEEVPLAVHEHLEAHTSDGGGLLGQFFNPLTGKAHKEHSATITLGARSDSYYEYLLKQWLLTGKTEGWLRHRYVQAMRSVRSRLLKRTAPSGQPGLWYVAEQLRGGQLSGKMDHLVCFLPGLLALGDYHNVSTREGDAHGFKQTRPTRAGTPVPLATAVPLTSEAAAEAAAAAAARMQEAAGDAVGPDKPGRAGGAELSGQDMPDLQLAHELALSCYELYRRTPAGLAPEIAHFANNTELSDFPNRHVHDVGHGDFSIKPNDAHNLLRPESVESFFLLWKVTGDPQYKQWAWQVFRALEKWAQVRPVDRQDQCSTCLAEAAFEAARHAKQAAAAEAAAQGTAGTAGDGTQQAQQAQQQLLHKRAMAAAAEVLQRQLRGGEVCASCSDTGGYSSLETVLEVPPARRDKMESFFLAETLKYLYLIFVEPPDRCVHPSCQQPGSAAAAAEAAGQAGRQQQQQAEPHASSGGGNGGAAAQQQQQQQGGASNDDVVSSSLSQHQQKEQRQQSRRPLLPLDRFVFTTEAHPLPVVGSSIASQVDRVLDPNSPLLRPFEGSLGAECAAALAPQQQQQQWAAKLAAVAAAKATQQGGTVVFKLGGATAEAVEEMMHRLAEAAAALTGKLGLQDGSSGSSSGGPAAVPAAGRGQQQQRQEEEEEDPYEDVEDDEVEEEDDSYLDDEVEEEEGQGQDRCSGSSGGQEQQEQQQEEEDDPYEDVEDDEVEQGGGGAAAGADDEDDPYDDPAD